MYKNYEYGIYKSKIVKLLRRRLALLDKIRYHTKKVEQFKKELPQLEQKLNELLELAKSSS